MRILIALLLATSAFAADTCSSAQKDLQDYLQTLPTTCTADSDCTGRYFGADACAPPVVTNKEKFTDNHHLFLLQKAVRVACGTQDKPRPVCSPIPYRATCRQNKCVDTLREHIALLPKGAYRFGTINHSCGPADGPALAISLTQTGDQKQGPWLNIYINEHLPELPVTSPKTYDLKLGADAGSFRCTSNSDCARADSGTVTLDHLDGNGGSGRYSMHFTDGTTEEGSFELHWIEVRMMCG
jgi:hypothetical protein